MKLMVSIITTLIIVASSPVDFTEIIKASAAVTDFVVKDNTIVVATIKGSVETYDIKSHKLIRKYKFPQFKDFTGELIDAEVFHLSSDKSSLFALVHADNSKNDIYKIEAGSAHKIINGTMFNSIIVDFEAVEDNKLLIALLSNEIVLYDINTKKQNYRKQISPYAFSSMCLQTNYAFTSDESGEIHRIAISNGKILRTFKGENVDNVLCVAATQSYVVGGGKDRRISFYNIHTETSSHICTDYFVTTMAANNQGYLAWFNDNTNSIELYSVNNRKKLKSLKGHKSMVNKLEFSNGKLISCDNDSKIIFWNL